jgi:hypothetical protein
MEYSRTTMDDILDLYFSKLLAKFYLTAEEHKWEEPHKLVVKYVTNDNPTVVESHEYFFTYLAPDKEDSTNADYDRAMKGI